MVGESVAQNVRSILVEDDRSRTRTVKGKCDDDDGGIPFDIDHQFKHLFEFAQ